ncbi:tRNA (N6-isopentenyl adenosine(37)-C2)-methylthiotransferase MiaB [soil metagenome]
MTRTFFLQTFGCQMNVHDSERMVEGLSAHGWSEVAAARDADVVVLNTCSVREKAEQKLRSEVGRLALLKRERPELVIAVAGCVAQQEGEKLLLRNPALDLVVGPDNLGELPALLEAQGAGSPPVVRTVFDVDEPHFLSAKPPPGKAPVSAFITTMKGCDERCSFCVVPYTRGPERYRPVQEILDAARTLVAAGAREIVLLGQTVDSYRDASLPPPVSDDPDESQFPHLLRAIAAAVPELARLRYTSPHPRHCTEALARAHADLDVLAKHVHMPVQSGSNRMLRRMIRRYTREEYVERVRRLQAARPGLTLSTDIIVGFPGETDDDFEATLGLVREVGFVAAFAFKFSPRPHTPALKLIDDVPEDVKAARLARLFEVVELQGQAHLASRVGHEERVLVEGSQAEGRFEGRTERNEIMHIEGANGLDLVGLEVQVKVTRANRHSLGGELTIPSRAAAPRRAATPQKPRSLPILDA